jgi:uncharacterized protein (DUF362 family)
MKPNEMSRREFIRAGLGVAMVGVPGVAALTARADGETPVVSIVRIVNNQIEAAVEEAIDLLGGITKVTEGKNRILLKPNLVIDDVSCTTKPAVIQALARLLQNAGKEVLIGEGSAAVNGFNSLNGTSYLTRCEDILDGMQRWVFDRLGYTALAKALGIPLVNLHTGEMVTVPVPLGLFWKELTLHRELVDIDLLVSVPMMKTHACATVTLGLKNVIGLYPGAIYGSCRWWVHDSLSSVSPGVAFEILDMARVNKMGLTAADMVGAAVMGFTDLEAIPTFKWAHALGMTPTTLADIEVRGETIASVKRNFTRPSLVSCYTGSPEIYPVPRPKLMLTSDGKGLVSWDDAIPRPRLEYTTNHKAYVTWTNTSAGIPKPFLEQNTKLQKTGWVRRAPQAAGHYEFDASPATNAFFRLRRQY